MKILKHILAGALVLVATATPALASPIVWTDWTSATVGHPGSASGTLTRLDGSIVTVTYSGDVALSTQTGAPGDINYWNPATPYLSATVSNAPPASDIITLDLASGATVPSNHLHFSSPVLDPVMAIVSLGRETQSYWVTYTFDQDFTLLSHAPGYWGTTEYMERSSPGVLLGKEGHGAIQFSGLITDISWTNTPSEYWHGFTVGEPVPEPASLTLLGFGLAGVAAAMRRRKK